MDVQKHIANFSKLIEFLFFLISAYIHNNFDQFNGPTILMPYGSAPTTTTTTSTTKDIDAYDADGSYHFFKTFFSNFFLVTHNNRSNYHKKLIRSYLIFVAILCSLSTNFTVARRRR